MNALGLGITVINALGLELVRRRRNVQRPSRGAAPVRQRPSTEETVAEFEDMRLRPPRSASGCALLRGQGIVEGQPLASMFLIEQSHPSA